GDLRPRFRKPQPARLRGSGELAGRQGRSGELGLGLPSVELPGHALPCVRDADPEPRAASGGDAGAATRDAGCGRIAQRPAHGGDGELEARIRSFEMAYRMQMAAKELVDFSGESEETRRLYGLDAGVSRPFGEKCLLARRLVERGVRFVQAYVNDEWDAHDD